MPSFVKVAEGADTLHVEEGFSRTDLEHVWKEKFDKKSERPFFVNI